MTTASSPDGLPPAPRRPSRRSFPLWLGSLLVIATAAAVAVPLALAGGGDQPGHGTDTPASPGNPAAHRSAPWQAPKDAGLGSYILNSYVAAHQVIVASAHVIVSYDQHGGRQLWRVKPPSASGYPGSGSAIFCGASSALSGTMLAVAFGKDGRCALVAVINVAAGKIVWTAAIVSPSQATANVPHAVLVEATGPTVVVGFGNEIGAFSLAGGRFLGWHLTLSRRDRRYQERDSCNVTDLLSAGDARHVYFTDRCVLSGEIQYGVVDTTTQTMRGENVMPSSVPFKLDRGELVSANPLVILLLRDGLTGGEYLFFDATSRLVAKLPTRRLSVGDISFNMPPGDFHQRWRAITDGHTLITVTRARANRANRLVAIDTATGKIRWSVSLDGAHVDTPVAIDNGRVLVAAGARAGRGALEVVRVDEATGKVISATASTRHDFIGNANLGEVTQFGWDNGRVFGVPSTHAMLNLLIRGPAAFEIG